MRLGTDAIPLREVGDLGAESLVTTAFGALRLPRLP